MADVELVELEPQPVAVVRGHVTVDGIPGFLGEAYDEVIRALTAQGHKPAGPPFGRYERTDSGFFVVAGFLAPLLSPRSAGSRLTAFPADPPPGPRRHQRPW